MCLYVMFVLEVLIVVYACRLDVCVQCMYMCFLSPSLSLSKQNHTLWSDDKDHTLWSDDNINNDHTLRSDDKINNDHTLWSDDKISNDHTLRSDDN